MKEETEIDGAAEVAKDPLESGEVWLPGSCIWRQIC